MKLEPTCPDPFIRSDPFWGNTSSWVAVPIIVGFILTVVLLGFLVGWSVQ